MKWEDICSRCGLCCHEKVIHPDALVIDLSQPCRFYDGKWHECTVYRDRFSSEPRCCKVSPLMAAFGRSLPDSCAYVEWARRHHLRFRRPKELVLSSSSDAP